MRAVLVVACIVLAVVLLPALTSAESVVIARDSARGARAQVSVVQNDLPSTDIRYFRYRITSRPRQHVFGPWASGCRNDNGDEEGADGMFNERTPVRGRMPVMRDATECSFAISGRLANRGRIKLVVWKVTDA